MKHDAEARTYGFRDEDDFSSTLMDFILAQMATLRFYAKAELALQGGPQYMTNPPRQLHFILKCLCARGTSHDPASTFELVGSRWVTIEEYKSTRIGALNWRIAAEGREDMDREYRGDPRYIGLLPVRFFVEDFTPSSGMLFPQHLSIAPFFRPPHPTESEDVRKMLADILVICASSIRLGLSLMSVERQLGVSLGPLPGRYVRTNKRWKWEQLLVNWEEYLKGPRGIQKVDSLIGDAALQCSEFTFDKLMGFMHVL